MQAEGPSAAALMLQRHHAEALEACVVREAACVEQVRGSLGLELAQERSLSRHEEAEIATRLSVTRRAMTEVREEIRQHRIGTETKDT